MVLALLPGGKKRCLCGGMIGYVYTQLSRLNLHNLVLNNLWLTKGFDHMDLYRGNLRWVEASCPWMAILGSLLADLHVQRFVLKSGSILLVQIVIKFGEFYGSAYTRSYHDLWKAHRSVYTGTISHHRFLHFSARASENVYPALLLSYLPTRSNASQVCFVRGHGICDNLVSYYLYFEPKRMVSCAAKLGYGRHS